MKGKDHSPGSLGVQAMDRTTGWSKLYWQNGRTIEAGG